MNGGYEVSLYGCQHDTSLTEKHISRHEYTLWSFVIILITLIASYPLFTGHLVVGHDIFFHFNRIEDIKDALLGGQFPVRIEGASAVGLGSPTGIFYPNLFMYIPAALRIIGFSPLVSYNAFSFLINLATAFIAWWSFAKLFSSSRIGAVAAMFHVSFLYRLMDMYSRSAIGESLAMIFLPLALIGLWLTLHRSPDYWPAVVLGFTGVLSSHVLSSVALLGASLAMAFVSFWRLFSWPTLKAIFKAALFTLLLNIWFYAPFYSFYKHIDFHMKQNSFGGSLDVYSFTWGCLADVHFLCGLLLIFLLAFFLGKCLYKKLRTTENVPLNLGFILMLGLSLLIVFATSESFPWLTVENIPFVGEHIKVMQFPFRFMMLASIPLSE